MQIDAEALRARLEEHYRRRGGVVEWQRQEVDRLLAEDGPLADLIHRSALSEETVRAVEDMRSAFAKVLLIQARELKRLAPDGDTPADLDAAMADLRAALPATPEAGR